VIALTPRRVAAPRNVPGFEEEIRYEPSWKVEKRTVLASIVKDDLRMDQRGQTLGVRVVEVSAHIV